MKLKHYVNKLRAWTKDYRCAYADCRYPEAKEHERVTCPECRVDLGLDPL